ncbi:MAG TPA: adenylate/guanylate cyclase domain-containing protein [Actinomycetota bacterium]|nr:adenylate/guanylate cyclase domain-containing protein [Actinomycetota bacterium]
MSIRVVLGDDNVLVREGVRALLNATDGIEVVGVAEDAPTLLAAANEHQPDVVVTDIKMPPNFQLEGIECAHQIRKDHPSTGVVVLSAHDDEAYALALLGGGESGLAYLLKDRLGQGDELPRAIREVAQGGSSIDPTIAARLSGRAEDRSQEDQQILDMMAKGMGYAEMAAELQTTQEAIDRRVTQMFQELAAQASRGATAAVDELKRLHAAAVEGTTSAKTMRSYVAFADRMGKEEEEVEATILFSDLRGFTSLAEELPARQMADVLARHLAAMGEVVLAHGGTIDKFAGDAVMAVWLQDSDGSNHARLALQCALAMQQRQRELNWETWMKNVGPLDMGIGVNSGPVILSAVGGADRRETTVLGDAVNVASRLQSVAGGGEVLATASTMEACPGVDAELLGPRLVKGRKEPVEVYRVVSVPDL